ncbi:hypothetical protein QYE76_034913 [Lolium multiflorum]|uniref:Retrotransposon gag domain-containing protein n=1 Tax=Lolium multiflorum TaxID=4521 RepID=A0AAD8VNI4_LOLMU|nr:hypothetical protein QYE76_034913 [Lolium multiflorum]
MIHISVQMAPPNRNANQDALVQMLQLMMEDREAERAERHANITALQQLAQNNQGHGNHDHPGSKLKNFQNTNPPVFSKTEEPLDADDWLQTMENNLEVAGVEDNDKVLFATHYLAGPARAWWTSARALNAGQLMTWADFKLKFSKYHVPPGLIKKMRDEFRELKQGRLTVVEYRDRFLTLSRYAPDETDTTEKRKERFLNGLHDEMQTVLVNIPFADLEALVDSAIQMEGKLNQANDNRKRRMMHQSGPSNTSKFRPSSSGGFTPRNNRPPAQMSRPGYQNRSGGNPRTEDTTTTATTSSTTTTTSTALRQEPLPTPTPTLLQGLGATLSLSPPRTSPPSTAMSVAWWGTTPTSVPRDSPRWPPTPLALLSSNAVEDLTKGYSRLCGAENTREKRALRRAGIRRGNSLPEGEIDAIAIIERDIISIIIIIISTIYTAITTAAPRHRCNNSVADACKGYNHNESFIETACQHLLLLVGIDILTYRRYYDTPPILVGHQDYFLAPLPGSEALLRSSLQFLFGKSTTTATVVDEAPGISMNEVRKKLFTISLSGKAAHWYKLLKNGDSIDWEDIVPLFYSKFYPPSEIHKDRNRIYNFWPHDGESIAQAWGRLKSLMLKCPIHELPGNVIIDNFYARLSFQDKTLLDTSCSGSFTRNKEEFKRDLLDRIQENTEGWENDKDRESGIIYDYKCIEAFMDTDKFRNMSATYGLDSQVVANLYKAFASHYELPKKNFDKYHEPYKDKVDSSVNKCVVIETVDNVIPEAYIEKTPFPAKMKEYSVISSAVNKSEKKPKEPEEQIKIEPAVAIVKDLVTENVEDGHIIFCEDASNIVSHPNKPKQVSVPMLSVRIGDHCYYGLCDIGASISAIPYELYTEIMHEIGSCELEDIDVVIHLANRETISPIGIVRDVEVLCGKIKYPADFLVLGSAASDHCPIIFGRPFLNTCGAIIDCKKEKILTRFAGEPYEFNFSKFTKTPYKADLPSNDFKMEQCASIVLVPNNPLQQHLENSESEAFRKERDELEEIFLRQPILKHDLPVEDLGTTPPPKEDPVFDLKPLPDNLKYAHIDDKKIYPVIISSKLSEIEEERLLEILKKHRGAIGYTLDDLKGISPSICQHAINMEEDAKPVVEHQRRLIPKMKEVVRNEVLKLLEAGIIYPIADSRWVSPVHCVPKKGGMTVVPNDNDELIPQRIVVDNGGSQKGKKGSHCGPRPRPARPMAWPRHPWCGGPTAPFASFLRVLRPENLSHREDLTKGYSRLCGAENTREKRALRRAGIRRGNSLPEGEIDAIAIVIERDIISIIIIIISTIYTAITTAAPRHRCNNSG